jgi:hypothetical protein
MHPGLWPRPNRQLNLWNWRGTHWGLPLSGVVLSLVLFWSPQAHAGLFKITNRSYGTAGAAAISSIDTVFDSLETQVNSALPDTDSTRYLKSIANASVLSQAGMGVDYAGKFEVLQLGGSGGLAADLGNTGLSDLLSGKVQANQVGGFAGQYTLVIGSRPSVWGGRARSWISTERMRVFANFFSSSFKRNAVDLKFTSWGVHALYRVVKESRSSPAFQWNGIDLVLGVRHTSMDAEIRQTLNQTSTGTITSAGSPTLTTNFTGTAKVAAELSTTSFPIEWVSSVRIAEFLSPYFGVATDIATGSAKSNASLSGPITATDSSGTLGTISGTGSLDLGGEQGPSVANFRGFLGTAIEVGALGFYLQYNQSFTPKLMGVSGGVRLFL